MNATPIFKQIFRKTYTCLHVICLVFCLLTASPATPAVCPQTDLQKLETAIKDIVKKQNKQRKKVKSPTIRMTDKDIKQLSSVLLAAHQSGLSFDLLISIAIAESGLNPKAVNRHTHDYGLFQINRRNFVAYKLHSKCYTDIVCNTQTAVKVLQHMHIKYSHKELNWYARYNVGTNKSAHKWTAYSKYANKINKIRETL